MMTEFDYEREAQSMEDERRNMECGKYAKRVLVPEPIMELCSKNLLVMEMLEGKKIADSMEDKLAAALGGGDKQLERDFLQAKRDGGVIIDCAQLHFLKSKLSQLPSFLFCLFPSTFPMNFTELMAGDDKKEVAHEGLEDIEVHNLVSRGGGAVSTKKSRQVVSSSPVSNSDPLPTKKRPPPPNLSIMGLIRKPCMAISLLNLFRQTRGYIDLLLDVSGYQIFIEGCCNDDPHPGNVMDLNDGRLGPLEYGQCQRLEEYERIALAQIVAWLGKRDNTENNEDDKSSFYKKDIADAMRKCGFRSKYNRDDMLVKYAELFFDSDSAGKPMGFESPHLYFRHLMKLDKLQNVPDCAVFVGRSSFLFRGMGAMLDNQFCTAKQWACHAEGALENSVGPAFNDRTAPCAPLYIDL